MKKQLIEEIKELLKINQDEIVEINPKYLDYFEEEELLNIKDKLESKKREINKISNDYLDEIYLKTKKNEL
ncbi:MULTISPECIES: hypothetical protein [Arcobacteraceae]|jgi:galactokinase/mevalonate kinase-like predicted kinase|uniref:Uncharacterized protein n=7 Tax=Arcobacteraceae TaxID=2808963 RepID=A8EU84_ALIB4|nr:MULTISPECIES: hypothetical protein [Arcobacteraceae]ABV67508.1 hypothetical protein Abu_1251 [Aliarcobacter butzleri RM4018]AGR77544.1 hypothetical protein A7H1H_1248 [Aliarcobacter butzleri 7h1h]KLD97178.1 hypothetical protein AF74_06940 [Aliarcobacter butzleri L349]KLE02272.1 hypothetical protein AF76_02675 [Aliarcobacter butzleri L351]KLE02584.1 hypothetical protein AA20_00335 [Aliarcobacter butzleri L348]